MTEFGIPISCPRCTGKLVCIHYDSTFRFLKKRSWNLCRNCGFQQSSDDFKKELFVE